MFCNDLEFNRINPLLSSVDLSISNDHVKITYNNMSLKDTSRSDTLTNFQLTYYYDTFTNSKILRNNS